MKFYVISDSTEYGLAAANQINSAGHVALMSESISNDSRILLGDLRSNISSGYDIIMIICDNAKDLSISANKIGGVMAVVCKDRDDAVDAVSSTRANVVLIDSAKLDRRTLPSIINGLLAEQKAESKSEQKRQAPVARQKAPEYVPPAPSGPGMAEKAGSFLSGIKDKASNAASGIGKQQPAVKPKNVSRAQSGDGAISSIKKKGLSKSIKDAFGIIDDK